MSGLAGSNVETCPYGDPNRRSSNHSHGGDVVDRILGSSSPKLGDPETQQVEDTLFIEEATPTSPTSKIPQSANVKPTNSLITSKYKTKEEKKKARLARRKANRAMFGYKRGNNRKAPNVTVPTEGNSLETKSQSTVEVSKQQPSSKHSNKGTTADDRRRSSINKCRHLAVAVRREDRAPVDEALAKLIRKRLTDLIGEEVNRIIATDSSGGGGRVIQFQKSGLVSAGFFLVTPATVEARDWLLSRDFGLLDGTRVVAKKLERKKSKSRSGNEKIFPQTTVQNTKTI